jgi:hypothetical protein
MPKTWLIVLLIFLTGCLISCQKGGNGSPHLPNDAQNLIIGKWTLQQEHVLQYIDGTKHTDTVYTAATNNYAMVQFNSNGTFASASLYSSGNNSGGLSSGYVTTSDSTSGVYAITASSFSTSAPVAGFGSGGVSFYGVTGTQTAPVITPVSHLSAINQLQASKLELHTEYVYTLTANSISQTYKIESDYSYSK